MNPKVEKLKKNIPELRFSGFDGEWEEKRLGEVADIYQPQTISQSDLSIDGEFDAWGANGIIGKYKKYNHDQEQVIVTCRGSTCGTINLTTPFSWITGNAMVINVDDRPEVAKAYLFNYLQNDSLQYLVSGSGQPQITGNIKKHKIRLPSIHEQQKIAAFLTAVDEWIGNLKSQKGKWEEYKKGMMQKMFPGGVGQAAEIRFKDENGNDFPEWEEKRLGDVANVIGGGTPDTTVADFWGGGIVWFTPTEIKHKYLSESERTITSEGVARSSATILPVGTVLLTTRATIGDVGIAVVECATNQGFQSFIVHDDQANEFWYYWLIQNKKEFVRRANGSTFSEISGTEIRKIKTLVPSLREQQKIAAFLTEIDEMINSHQQKIARAEEWKKGLMQRMFV